MLLLIPFRQYLERLVEPRSIADVVIVFLVVYGVLKLLRGTRAAPMAAGIGVFAFLYWLAVYENLTTLEFVLRATPGAVLAHNHTLIDSLFSRLPVDRCVAASPLESKLRGPYGCFVARTPEKTAELYNKLRDEKVFVSLREGKIRVSPYLYNTIQDIDRLISVITT